jgi:hypothetical protein
VAATGLAGRSLRRPRPAVARRPDRHHRLAHRHAVAEAGARVEVSLCGIGEVRLGF